MKISFIGDFKKLKPMGYEFHKLFARNYICYIKNDVKIWRKAKDVQILDFQDYSHLLLQYLIDNNFIINDKHNRIVVNTETSKIEEYDVRKHELFCLDFDNMSDDEISQFEDRYHKNTIPQRIIETIKELYDNKLIEIVQD